MENSKPLIPKSLKRYKGTIWNNFTFFDLGIFMVWMVIDFFITMSIPNYIACLVVGTFIMVLYPFLATPFGEDKVYTKLFKIVLFIFSKRKYKGKQLRLLLPYQEVSNRGIKLKNGNFIKIVQLNGFNLFLLPENERLRRMYAFQSVLVNQDATMCKLSLPNNLKAQKHNLQVIGKRWKNNSQVGKVVKIEKAILHKLIKNQSHFQNEYFLFIEAKNEKMAIRKYLNIKPFLNRAFLNPQTIIDKQKLLSVISAFYNDQYTSKKVKSLESICKNTINFKASYFKKGSYFHKIIMVSKFPKYANDGWLNLLNNHNKVDWIIKSNLMDKEKTIKKLDSVISKLRGSIDSQNRASRQVEDQDYLEGLEELNELVNADGESFISTKTFLMLKGESKKELDQLVKEVTSLIMGNNFKINKMNFMQKEVFSAFLPGTKRSSSFLLSNELSSLALAYGFPFAGGALSDPKGLYLGYNLNSGANIFFDPCLRDQLRKNSNIFLFGAPGGGKSTASKKLIKNLVLDGHRVLAMDPEREYKVLCKSLNGSWINFGTDHSYKEKNNVINPLQFLQNESDQRDLLQSHIQFLEQFFTILFPEMSLKERSFLRKELVKLYANHNITSKKAFQGLKNMQYPLLSELVSLFKKELIKTKDEFDKTIYKSLSIYFDVFDDKTSSPESTLWNNYTNFSFYNNIITVADLQSLFHSGNTRLGNAQMFLLMKMANSLMVQNKILKEKKESGSHFVLVVDEAHLLVDEQNPFALNFMYQFTKRARKYNAFIIITTQNVKDFIGSNQNTRDKTSAIINSSQYGLVLPMNSGDINNLDQLFASSGGLMNNEKEALAVGEVGQALFINGSKNRQLIQIDVADEEFEFWEGRKQKWKN